MAEGFPGNWAEGFPGNWAEGFPGNGAEGFPGNGAEGSPGNGAEGSPGNGAEGSPGKRAERSPGNGTEGGKWVVMQMPVAASTNAGNFAQKWLYTLYRELHLFNFESLSFLLSFAWSLWFLNYQRILQKVTTFPAYLVFTLA